MTVLHLDAGRELRGGQWQVIRLVRGLHKLGHRTILLARPNSPLLEYGVREGWRCDGLTGSTMRWASLQADLVHVHDSRSHTWAAILVRRPIVVSRRVVFPPGRGPLTRWKYSRARFYAAVSQAVATELVAAGVAEKRIRVIYDGVPLLSNGYNPRGPVVTPVYRGQGKTGDLPRAAAKLAQVPLLESSNLEADLEGASLFLYLTEREGLGSAALLAMSAGIPVIATDTGGLPEIVRHGETGFLTRNDAGEIAAAIEMLRARPVVTSEMAARARQAVAERFSEDRMVSDTLSLYESAIDAA